MQTFFPGAEYFRGVSRRHAPHNRDVEEVRRLA
jgi:hypothetical protein